MISVRPWELVLMQLILMKYKEKKGTVASPYNFFKMEGGSMRDDVYYVSGGLELYDLPNLILVVS